MSIKDTWKKFQDIFGYYKLIIYEVWDMKDYKEKAKLLYKILSNVYNLMDLIVFPNDKSNPRKGLARKLPNNNIKILDVACGTGNTSFAIAEKNPDNEIAAIDLSQDMLKIARKKAAKNKIKNISFKGMDAVKMDFENNYFDVVTISLAFHEMPQDLMNSILKEMSRVLKSKGRIYIIDWEKPKSFIKSKIFLLFPSLLEPKVFKQFLKINWSSMLNEFGFKYEGMEYYSFTKLIAAIKE